MIIRYPICSVRGPRLLHPANTQRGSLQSQQTSDEGKVSADAHTAAREFESLTPPPPKKVQQTCLERAPNSNQSDGARLRGSLTVLRRFQVQSPAQEASGRESRHTESGSTDGCWVNGRALSPLLFFNGSNSEDAPSEARDSLCSALRSPHGEPLRREVEDRCVSWLPAAQPPLIAEAAVHRNGTVYTSSDFSSESKLAVGIACQQTSTKISLC